MSFSNKKNKQKQIKRKESTLTVLFNFSLSLYVDQVKKKRRSKSDAAALPSSSSCGFCKTREVPNDDEVISIYCCRCTNYNIILRKAKLKARPNTQNI